MTNGDRIREMSDDELSGLLQAAYFAGQDDLAEYLKSNTYGERFIWTMEWLSKPNMTCKLIQKGVTND